MAVDTAGVCFATREDVQRVADVVGTFLTNAQVDRIIESESRNAEGLLQRSFVPVLDTRYFDWPGEQFGKSWRLWLNANELATGDTSDYVLTTQGGSVTLADNQWFIEPANYGPPFNRVEINLGQSGSFSVGATTQRALAITGLFGHSDHQTLIGTTADSPLLAADDLVTISEDTLAGVGSVLICEAERMLLTDRLMTATGRTLNGDLAQANNAVQVPLSGTATVYAGETILVDGERMLVQDMVANTATVLRAYSGTALAAHTSGATVYAGRQFKVIRGAIGTTAANHGSGTEWFSWNIPGALRKLVIAESINTIAQERSNYARMVGSGDHQIKAALDGLSDARSTAVSTLGRQARVRTV